MSGYVLSLKYLDWKISLLYPKPIAKPHMPWTYVSALFALVIISKVLKITFDYNKKGQPVMFFATSDPQLAISWSDANDIIADVKDPSL